MKKMITTISEELKTITRKEWIIVSLNVVLFALILVVSQLF